MNSMACFTAAELRTILDGLAALPLSMHDPRYMPRHAAVQKIQGYCAAVAAASKELDDAHKELETAGEP